MENPQDVTKCFGCQCDLETYTYVQTKTGKHITHTDKNREVKASQVELDDVISGDPLTTAQKTYHRLLMQGWTPMTHDDFPVGYPDPDPSEKKPSRLKDFFCRVFNLTKWHDVSSRVEIQSPKVSENGMVH